MSKKTKTTMGSTPGLEICQGTLKEKIGASLKEEYDEKYSIYNEKTQMLFVKRYGKKTNNHCPE